ncbi:MAG: methyltransferase family protein [Omnitrophica WOR_2 bacterium]
MNYTHGFIHILFTLVVYLGLPLAGWGMSDLSGFFSNPARLGYALFVGVSAILAAYQGMVIPEGQDQKEKRVSRQTIFLVLVEILGMALLVLLGYSDRRDFAVFHQSQGMRIAGLVLSVAGGAVMFWSVLNLGKQYSAQVTIQKEHRLITVGLYRFIRHPRYLGLTILLLGTALLFRSWAGLVADFILLAALVWRIGDEEILLHQEFGDRWDDYCRHTWRMLPGIW